MLGIIASNKNARPPRDLGKRFERALKRKKKKKKRRQKWEKEKEQEFIHT